MEPGQPDKFMKKNYMGIYHDWPSTPEGFSREAAQSIIWDRPFESVFVPATIDDPATLDGITEVMEDNGYGSQKGNQHRIKL